MIGTISHISFWNIFLILQAKKSVIFTQDLSTLGTLALGINGGGGSFNLYTTTPGNIRGFLRAVEPGVNGGVGGGGAGLILSLIHI